MLLGHEAQANDHRDDLPAAPFARPPISLREEVGAYEALWLSASAWFKNIAELFERNSGAVPSDLVPRETVSETFAALVDALGESMVERIGVRLHRTGDYPAKLRDADHPVELLYYMGNWDLVYGRGVAVVGTRNPSEDGIENARRIARSLVKHDFTVVSGLAKGIDTAAMTEAMACGGHTIGVIGTPLNEVYPKENRQLQEAIAAHHLLISQVPFLRYKRQHYKANSLFFPARNVTMSALTEATVIVEAGNTSGTLVQARAALAQKRKLFILDSCFRNTELTWPAKFLEKGAIRVSTAGQIIEALKDGESHTTTD